MHFPNSIKRISVATAGAVSENEFVLFITLMKMQALSDESPMSVSSVCLGFKFNLVICFFFFKQVGHVDFYPNGGDDMPGCPLLEIACDHFRSVYYFEESIRSTGCAFTAYPCETWNQYQTGLCTRCGLAGCPEMGYNADQSTATGSFYLATNDKETYCKQ